MMRHERLSPRDRVVLANEEAPIWAAYRMPADRQVRNDGLFPSIRTGLMRSEAPFGLRPCFRRSVRTPIPSPSSLRAPRSVRTPFLSPSSVRAPRSVRTPILSPSSVRAPPAAVPSVFLGTPFLKEVGLSRPVSFKKDPSKEETSASRRACSMLRSFFLSPVRCSCISEDLFWFVRASLSLGCYAPNQEVLRDGDMHRTMHERSMLEDVFRNCLCVALSWLLLCSKMFFGKRLLF